MADENTLEFKNKGVAIHEQVSFKNFTVIVEQVTTSGDTAAEIKHKVGGRRGRDRMVVVL